MRYHRTPSEWLKSMIRNNRGWRGCGEKGTLLHCWWECELVQPLWETVWRFLKKLRIERPYDPAIARLGIYPANIKTLIQRDTCTPVFIAPLFTMVNIRKQPKCPSIKEDVVIDAQWNVTQP
uniref:Uncharacterized protein n=1 Tax=Canis lupus familiaris TaxID=9615 RepID=A0A8I3NT27_CANLF